MRPSSLRILLVPSALLACKSDLPDPIWEGEHLHYGDVTDAPVCRGSFFRQQQHAVEMSRMLGVELSDVIRFTRVDPASIPAYCKDAAIAGCAWVDEPYAFAIDSFDYHEIAHVVASLAGLAGPQPFREGFAEVFDDGADSTILGTALGGVLRGSAEDTRDYHTAGRFTRFLIERHALERVVAFLRATPRDATFDEFSPVFAEVFGEPLAAAMAAFAEYPNCSDKSNRIAVVDCNLPTETWEDEVLTLTAEVACDRDDVLGPHTGDEMFTTRGFEVEQSGSFRLSASEPSGWSRVHLVRCGSCWDEVELGIHPGSTSVVELTAGRYYVEFARKVDAPAGLELVVERL